VTIDFTSHGDFSSTLWDEGLLRHILGNLLSNAIKYSHPDSKVKFELVRQDKTAIFRIQDWGIGIAKKDQNQLFIPFHRGDNVGGISGTGMGLAIVKKCVEAHGGEILVDSQIDVGTTFTVTLPLIQI
jgi:signal transduction histidine kinase